MATGETNTHRDGTKENRYDDGFLIKDSPDGFTVLNLELRERRYATTPPGTPEYSRVGFQVRDLAKEVAARLESVRGAPKRAEGRRWAGTQLNARTRTFVCA